MTENWQERKYNEVFEETMTRLGMEQRMYPADRFRQELEARLRDQYVYQGHGWDGRNELGDVIIEATIAAFQQKMAELDEE
jgi:hypothetical protein